jgi:hypothetical protein
VLGLGLEYDETLLGAVAQRSGGRFHYLARPADVARVFRDEVMRLERVAGRNAVVTMTPGPGVTIQSVVGNQPQPSGRGLYVALGDLAVGESRDLVVELSVEGRRSAANVELLDALLVFDDAVGEAGRVERRLFLGAHATENEQELASGRNEEVLREAARIEAAAATVQAIELARSGEVDRAREVLAEGAARIGRDAPPETQAFADDMEALGAALPAVAPAAASGPPAEAPARVVREVHDRAMSEILGH